MVDTATEARLLWHVDGTRLEHRLTPARQTIGRGADTHVSTGNVGHRRSACGSENRIAVPRLSDGRLKKG